MEGVNTQRERSKEERGRKKNEYRATAEKDETGSRSCADESRSKD